MHRSILLLAAAATLLGACGLGEQADPGSGSAAPTATVTATETVTETVTASPQPGEASPTQTAGAEGACADLEGGEDLAFIFVSEPAVGTTVTSGFQVRGCSNTFEATYQWELLDRAGEVLASDFGTATCGTGCVGEFAFAVGYQGVEQRQVGTLRVFATSPQDGSETSVNAIPVVLQP